MYSSKQAPFLVTETNAGAIGGPAANFPAYDGQWRQVAWAMVARGAQMIEYWHWHTLHFGTETYWIGILPHDQQPGRVYEQLAVLGGELRTAGDVVAGLTPDAGSGCSTRTPRSWADLPAVPVASAPSPTCASYEHIVEAFYRGAFDAGVGVRILHDVQVTGRRLPTAASTPPTWPATCPCCWSRRCTWPTTPCSTGCAAYAEAGGHLVLGPRTAYADHEARARLEPKPARLADAAGVGYQEFTNLSVPVPGARLRARGLDLPAGRDRDPVGRPARRGRRAGPRRATSTRTWAAGPR